MHRGQDVPSEVLPDGQIRTTIGTASYSPSVVPVNRTTELFDDVVADVEGREIRGSSLSTGSTHTVIPVDVLPSRDEIASLGPQLEYLPIFPDRTSVIFLREIAPMELQIGIWERGVGETLGCGTGSSAAAVDYLRRKGEGGKVLVRNPGGNVSVSMDAWDSPITIQGEASAVFRGSFVFANKKALR